MKRVLFSAFFLFLFQPKSVFALQIHPYPEGLYSHQLGHMFFIICMGIFARRLFKRGLHKQFGWKYFFYGSIFLILWNIDALLGHWVALYISKDQIILQPGYQIPHLSVSSFKDVIYYLFRLDHLFCVPALLCFYLGLRNLRSKLHQTEKRKRGGMR